MSFKWPNPENRLISRAISGDDRAFDELTKPLYERLRNFCAKFLDSQPDVEDVVSETMTIAWEKLSDFDQKSMFSTWLFGIASNKCFNRVRLRDREEQQVLNIQKLMSSQYESSDFTVAIIKNDHDAYLVKIILTLLEKKSEVDRDIFLFRAERAWPFQEIAALVGMETNAVQHRYDRMCVKLLKVMTEIDNSSISKR